MSRDIVPILQRSARGLSEIRERAYPKPQRRTRWRVPADHNVNMRTWFGFKRHLAMARPHHHHLATRVHAIASSR